MNKILCTALLGLLFVGMTEAFGRRGGVCGSACGVVSSGCATACEPVEPICYKTVRVPARRIVTPVPATCVRTPQPAKCIRIPQPPIAQPDKVVYEAQPDVISYKQNPPIISYACPADANICNTGCNTGCGTACAA